MKKRVLGVLLLLIVLSVSLFFAGCSSNKKEVYYLKLIDTSSKFEEEIKEKDNYITLYADGTYEVKESFPDTVLLKTHEGTYTKEGDAYKFSDIGLNFVTVKDDTIKIVSFNGAHQVTLTYERLEGLSKVDLFIVVCVISGLLVAGMTVVLIFQIRKYNKVKKEETARLLSGNADNKEKEEPAEKEKPTE